MTVTARDIAPDRQTASKLSATSNILSLPAQFRSGSEVSLAWLSTEISQVRWHCQDRARHPRTVETQGVVRTADEALPPVALHHITS